MNDRVLVRFCDDKGNYSDPLPFARVPVVGEYIEITEYRESYARLGSPATYRVTAVFHEVSVFGAGHDNVTGGPTIYAKRVSGREDLEAKGLINH